MNFPVGTKVKHRGFPGQGEVVEHHSNLPGYAWVLWPEWSTPTQESFEDLVTLADVKAALADEAKAIVTGARRSAYGTPEDNFERIARFWQAYFENTGRGDVKLTAADISPLMRLMKEARLCETPDHRDSFVDLIGYTLTGAEINKVDPQKPA